MRGFLELSLPMLHFVPLTPFFFGFPPHNTLLPVMRRAAAKSMKRKLLQLRPFEATGHEPLPQTDIIIGPPAPPLPLVVGQKGPIVESKVKPSTYLALQ